MRGFELRIPAFFLALILLAPHAFAAGGGITGKANTVTAGELPTTPLPTFSQLEINDSNYDSNNATSIYSDTVKGYNNNSMNLGASCHPAVWAALVQHANLAAQNDINGATAVQSLFPPAASRCAHDYAAQRQKFMGDVMNTQSLAEDAVIGNILQALGISGNAASMAASAFKNEMNGYAAGVQKYVNNNVATNCLDPKAYQKNLIQNLQSPGLFNAAAHPGNAENYVSNIPVTTLNQTAGTNISAFVAPAPSAPAVSPAPMPANNTQSAAPPPQPPSQPAAKPGWNIFQ